MLRNFSVVRKLDGHAWPPGFEQAVAANNASARGKLHTGAMWVAQSSERSLLTSLLAKLQQLDADVLVGAVRGGGHMRQSLRTHKCFCLCAVPRKLQHWMGTRSRAR